MRSSVTLSAMEAMIATPSTRSKVKALMPAATFGAWKLIERGLQPLSGLIGMFMTVELTKRTSR